MKVLEIQRNKFYFVFLLYFCLIASLILFVPLFLEFIKVYKKFSLLNRNYMQPIAVANPRPALLWLKVCISHLFTEEVVFFRHHQCSDSFLASQLLLDQGMTNACVMTFDDICIFICDIKNSSLLPQVFPSFLWNTINSVPRVSAK